MSCLLTVGKYELIDYVVNWLWRCFYGLYWSCNGFGGINGVGVSDAFNFKSVYVVVVVPILTLMYSWFYELCGLCV